MPRRAAKRRRVFFTLKFCRKNETHQKRVPRKKARQGKTPSAQKQAHPNYFKINCERMTPLYNELYALAFSGIPSNPDGATGAVKAAAGIFLQSKKQKNEILRPISAKHSRIIAASF